MLSAQNDIAAAEDGLATAKVNAQRDNTAVVNLGDPAQAHGKAGRAAPPFGQGCGFAHRAS